MSTVQKRRPRAATKWLAAIGAVAALTFVLAGCGGSGDSGGSGSAAAPAGYGNVTQSNNASAPVSGGAAKVDLASTGLGKVLVDGNGRTLYLFEADKSPMSTCDGACASIWPPLTTKGKPVAGAGLAAAKLGTSKRSDGTAEVTYNGHPLYTYAGDSKPGQTTGQDIDGFGAKWYVLSAAGNKIDNG